MFRFLSVIFLCLSFSLSSYADEQEPPKHKRLLIVNGLITKEGIIHLSSFLLVKDMPSSYSEEDGEFETAIIDKDGKVLHSLKKNLGFTAHADGAAGPMTLDLGVMPFATRLPYPENSRHIRFSYKGKVIGGIQPEFKVQSIPNAIQALSQRSIDPKNKEKLLSHVPALREAVKNCSKDITFKINAELEKDVNALIHRNIFPEQGETGFLDVLAAIHGLSEIYHRKCLH